MNEVDQHGNPIDWENRPFVVLRRFKSDGEWYDPNDIWYPDGRPFDDKLIDCEPPYVQPMDTQVAEQSAQARAALMQQKWDEATGEIDLPDHILQKLTNGNGEINLDHIRSAPDDELLAIGGIGQKTLERIRAAIG